MPERKKKDDQRGGKREGSGRPTVLKDPVSKIIRLEKVMIDQIEEKGLNVSQFLREATQRRLDEGW